MNLIILKNQNYRLKQYNNSAMNIDEELNKIWYQMNMKEISSEEARHQVFDLFSTEQINRFINIKYLIMMIDDYLDPSHPIRHNGHYLFLKNSVNNVEN